MAMSDRQVFLYEVDTDDGRRHYFSDLDPDWTFERGLDPETILGMVRPGADVDHLGPADIVEGGAFLRLLSRVIHENIADSEAVREQAISQGTGYVYLIDGRTPDPGGRVPPADIIGAVEVRDGVVVSGSYQHNREHRLFTAAGWFRLPDDLEAALRHRLRNPQH